MLLSIFILIIIICFFLEINHKLSVSSPLVIKPIDFKTKLLDNKYSYMTLVEIINLHKRMEIMIPSFKVKPHFIGISHDQLMGIKTKVKPLHPDEEEQKNDYWSSYILKSKKSTFVKIEIEFELNNTSIDEMNCVWVDIEWSNYGPFGFFSRFDGFVIPNYMTNPKEISSNNRLVYPIKTHILGTLDDPINVLKSYKPNDCLPTDILTIGETPLAIMQGKYIDYRTINVSHFARLICKGFHPTSSLATACGMQTLIDIYGPSRILFSWLIGGICKSFGIRGIFYRLAGKQARLIDDITGTTPPYDKSIVLGPTDTQSFCIKASKELNVNIAVVDVNDLGRVKVLSTNNTKNTEIIKRALISNPAGNANQLTPLVLIKPDEISHKSQDS
tara:strand:- start:93 stop:1256 length:1164 start_codon:yes stop_codon:yes gene_type:complete